MKRTSKNITRVSLVAAGLGLAAAVTTLGASAQENTRVFMVPKFTGFIFFELARDGGEQAAADLGAEFTYVGTTTADIEGQVQVFQNLVPQRPDCVVTAALDINAPVPVLKRMRARGTKVVTFDADVAPEGRDLFVNMAPFEVQARAMLESALANSPDGGEAIWIAPTATVANFISQKNAIDALIASDARYQSIKFIDTLYAEDDPEKSYSVATSAMQAHPNLKLFISGSGISNPAINKAIEDTGRSGEVFSTGFALPSTMTTYLENGTNKQYALWSPWKFGYLATYACIQLARGELSADAGNTFDIPGIGERSIDETATTNLSQMLFFRPGNDTFDTAIPMDQ